MGAVVTVATKTAMSDGDAARYARTMTDLQRKVLLLCSTGVSLGYRRISDKLGAPYEDVIAAGRFLQSASLAYAGKARGRDDEPAAAIFLNARGATVRLAAERLAGRASSA